MMKVYALLPVFMASLLLNAGDIEARLDGNTVYVGDRFSLHLTAESNSDLQRINTQTLKNSGFQVEGQNQSSQSVVRNGTLSSASTRTLQLVAGRAGVFYLDRLLGVTVVARSNMQLTVRDASLRPQTPGIAAVAEISLDVLPASKYRIGGNMEVVIRITLRGRRVESTMELPSAKDWEFIELQRQGPRTQYTNNQREDVYEYRYLFTPLTDGVLQLPVFTLKGRAILPGGRQPKRFSVPTKKKTVNVLPIPASWPQRATWLPTKKLELMGEWSDNPKRAKVGEPLTLLLRLRGENLSGSRLPGFTLPDIDGIRQYNEPAQVNSNIRNGVQISEKVLRVVMVPHRTGVIDLPEISIPWWDTEKDELRHARFTAPALLVVANADQALPLPLPDSQSTATSVSALTQPPPLWLWAGWVIAALLALLVIGMLWRQRKVAVAGMPTQPPPPISAPGTAAEAYERLLRWAAPHYTPEQKLLSYSQPQLAEQVRQLEQHLYTEAPLPDNFSMADLVKQVEKQKSQKTNPDKALSELYPS